MTQLMDQPRHINTDKNRNRGTISDMYFVVEGYKKYAKSLKVPQ